MSNKEDKQYGLILPKKKLQLSAPKPTNVFGNDNSSGEEEGTDWVKRALKEEGEKNKVKKQTKLDMQKALEQDPTIYQYDEVYDDMEQTKVQTKPTNTEKKKPKYIINLLKAAERRKKEQEHRIERMVQKEREAEGEMYADKESFVTSAYRAKLEEFKKMEEEEARMERIEALTDVTKQEDMSSFYRHLYAQTVDNKEQTESTAENSELNKNTDGKELTKIRENSPSSSTENKNIDDKSPSIDNSNKTSEPQISVKKPKKSKQYRQRIVESDESESDQEITKSEQASIKETTVESKSPKNDNSDKVEEPEKKKQKLDSEIQQENDEHKENNSNNIQDKTEATLNVDNEQNKENEKSEDAKEKEKQVVKKDKSSIWKKRTVGPVFEAALQRYYTRKAARMAAG